MDVDDPLVTIRMQYVEDLEDILQCPVCWELPTGLIFTCIRGHHVCEKCQTTKRLNVCPTCRSNFNGSRNYLAESLSSKFNDIKTSMLDPNHYINRKIVKKHIETQTATVETICVNTQTEVVNTSASTQTNFSERSIDTQTELNVRHAAIQTEQKLEPKRSSFIFTNNNNGEFNKEDTSTRDNCQIACLLQICKDKCSHDGIINHIEQNHKDNLIEVNWSENGLYRSEWNLSYEKNISFDYAINIRDMGLIFFNVFIDAQGDLYGNIEVINNYCNDQQLYYVLLITNVENGLLSEVFKGLIPSYLTCASKNNNATGIFIPGANFSRYLLDEKKHFDCSLTLYRPEEF